MPAGPAPITITVATRGISFAVGGGAAPGTGPDIASGSLMQISVTTLESILIFTFE